MPMVSFHLHSSVSILGFEGARGVCSHQQVPSTRLAWWPTCRSRRRRLRGAAAALGSICALSPRGCQAAAAPLLPSRIESRAVNNCYFELSPFSCPFVADGEKVRSHELFCHQSSESSHLHAFYPRFSAMKKLQSLQKSQLEEQLAPGPAGGAWNGAEQRGRGFAELVLCWICAPSVHKNTGNPQQSPWHIQSCLLQ